MFKSLHDNSNIYCLNQGEFDLRVALINQQDLNIAFRHVDKLCRGKDPAGKDVKIVCRADTARTVGF